MRRGVSLEPHREGCGCAMSLQESRGKAQHDSSCHHFSKIPFDKLPLCANLGPCPRFPESFGWLLDRLNLNEVMLSGEEAPAIGDGRF